MKKCCVPNCRRQNDDPECLDLKFFQVPTNEDKRKKWSDSLNNYFNKEIKFTKYSYICVLHFEQDSFHYGAMGKVIRLTQTSCPTIFEDRQHKGSLSNHVQEESSNHSSNNVPNTIEMDESGLRISLSLSMDAPSIQEFVRSEDEYVQKDSFIARYSESLNSQTTGSKECMYVDIFSEEDSNSFKNSRNGTIEETATTFLNKSLVNINLDSIDYENKLLVRRILEKAQADMRILRRKQRNQSMKLYRTKKRVLNGKSLISHMKERNFLSEKVSEILEVRSNRYVPSFLFNNKIVVEQFFFFINRLRRNYLFA